MKPVVTPQYSWEYVMRRSIAVLVAATMVSACASQQAHVGGWLRAHTAQEKAVQDYKECDYEASKATATVQDACSRVCEKSEVLSKCMEVRGYRADPQLH
jgi:hypothetical protein